MHTGRFGEYIDSGWSGAKIRRPESLEQPEQLPKAA